MSATPEGLSDIARHRPNVGAFGDVAGKAKAWEIDGEKLDREDLDGAGRKFDVLACTSEIVGALPLDLECGVGGRSLFLGAKKGLESVLDLFFGEVGGKGGLASDRPFAVESICFDPKEDLGFVAFVAGE